MIQKLYTDKRASKIAGGSTYNKIYKGSDLVFQYANTAYIFAEPLSFIIPKAGSTLTLTITSNDTWHITSIPSWATFSVSSGKGTAVVTITVGLLEGENREANFIISTSSKSIAVNMTQRNAQYVTEIYYELENTKCYIEIPVYSTKTLKWRIKGKYRQGTGDSMVGVSSTNDSNDYRFFYTGRVMYLDMGSSRASKSVTIQAGQVLDLTIENLSIYDNIADKYIVSITAYTGDLIHNPFKWYVNYLSMMEWQIWDGDTLIFDGKAAEQDGQGGIYDDLSGNFYTNESMAISYTE